MTGATGNTAVDTEKGFTANEEEREIDVDEQEKITVRKARQRTQILP